MWELTKRISLRTSSVFIEGGPGAGPLNRLRPKSTGSATLAELNIFEICGYISKRVIGILFKITYLPGSGAALLCMRISNTAQKIII